MKINQVELTKNFSPNTNNSKQLRINRPTSIVAALLVTLSVGYFSWRKIQLYVAQQLIHDCVENYNCADNISTLEQLVKTRKSLKLFNLATANLANANLENAYLDRVNLYRANFDRTNLKNANLSSANLYRANLNRANLKNTNLINAKNLTFSQIKSACHWEQAFYRGVWDLNQFSWVIDEKANQQFIEQLQQDFNSDPEKTVDCSEWE